MDEVIKVADVPKMCPQCHTKVRDADYFCFNCGKNLNPVPKSTSATAQTVLYLKSVLLPPLGIWYALPYLREDNQKSKMVGVVAIVLTVISLLIAFKLTKDLSDIVNQQVSEATSLYGI
jgi:uncharacterized membrane protein YvbJ